LTSDLEAPRSQTHLDRAHALVAAAQTPHLQWLLAISAKPHHRSLRQQHPHGRLLCRLRNPLIKADRHHSDRHGQSSSQHRKER
jgi:hypothetical protein